MKDEIAERMRRVRKGVFPQLNMQKVFYLLESVADLCFGTLSTGLRFLHRLVLSMVEAFFRFSDSYPAMLGEATICEVVIWFQRQEMLFMKPQRISIEKARKIALPILIQGFDKRRKMRSTSEEHFRVAEKLARDRRTISEPHICSI
jgi:hypothetical protein